MKKAMWIISFIALAGTAIVLQFMPDQVPMHYDAVGNIDRWGSKYENLIAPIILLVMSLFWTLLIRYYEKKALRETDGKEIAGAKSNAKVLGIVGLCMAVQFTVLQGFFLYGAYNEAVSGATTWAVDIGKVSVVLMGIIFIILGNFMTKTRINSTVGVRVSWSMYNDNTWRKSNRFGAYAIMIAGVVTIIIAVILKSSFGAAMTALGTVILASVLTLVYAHKVYVQEIESEKGGND
ncbi:MAG: SdpI family protein [Lachnospiraceae bacterium]|nr:SdpI family protein [Lachnospiraceae bacterium]